MRLSRVLCGVVGELDAREARDARGAAGALSAGTEDMQTAKHHPAAHLPCRPPLPAVKPRLLTPEPQLEQRGHRAACSKLGQDGWRRARQHGYQRQSSTKLWGLAAGAGAKDRPAKPAARAKTGQLAADLLCTLPALQGLFKGS